jgi:drug/metabolite transporter (DMT)-like permease
VPVDALLLALAAAAVHAVWNLILAGSRDQEGTAVVALLVAVVVLIPAVIPTWRVEAEAWPFVAGSAVFETLYYGLLVWAYKRSELSLVYPLARGVGPILILLFGVAALGVETSAEQAAGVAVIAGGVLLVRGIRRRAHLGDTLIALAIAACICGYTTLDKYGVRHANPIAYLELVLLGPLAFYLVRVLARRGTAPIRDNFDVKAFVAGLAQFGGYLMVLAALRLAPAASVAAVRETSVLIATVLAAPLLKERVGPGRIAGAALIVTGIALLGFGS